MAKLAFTKEFQKASALDMSQHNSVTGVRHQACTFKR